MKILTRILSLSVIASAALFYSGCGSKGGGTDSPQKIQLAKLTKTWTLTSASLDGKDRTSDFANLKLTISGTYSKDGDTYIYSFAGSRPNPSPWPASGTWKFGAAPTTDLIRLDSDIDKTYSDQSISYTLSDVPQLDIKFNYSGAGFAGSRVSQVSGNWEFVFSN